VIRLLALAFAAVLVAVPLRWATAPVVVVTGLVGLALAVAGIATLWRPAVTAAACVFLTEYAAALWISGASAGVLGATAYGLSLLFLVQGVELGGRLRHAAVEAGVVGSQIVAWLAWGAVTLAAALLALALARDLAASIPFAAAPLLAAAGALGALLTLAAAVRRAARGDAVRGRDDPALRSRDPGAFLGATRSAPRREP
jgi:hypothetical protein